MKYVHVGYEIRVSSSLNERPPQVDEVAVVLATPEPPPERLGVTHWSSRLLATRSWRRRSAPIHPQFASTREGRQGAFAYRTYPVNDPRARGSSANAPHDHYGQCCHSSSFFRAQRTGSGPFSARCSKRSEGCTATGNSPFKLTVNAKTIHAQAWPTLCTSGVISCKVGVAIWERGSAPPFLIAENSGKWVKPCKIKSRTKVNYTCITTHKASFYTEIFISTLTDIGPGASGSAYVNPEVTLACTGRCRSSSGEGG
jgi:hypothetical protein